MLHPTRLRWRSGERVNTTVRPLFSGDGEGEGEGGGGGLCLGDGADGAGGVGWGGGLPREGGRRVMGLKREGVFGGGGVGCDG